MNCLMLTGILALYVMCYVEQIYDSVGSISKLLCSFQNLKAIQTFEGLSKSCLSKPG